MKKYLCIACIIFLIIGFFSDAAKSDDNNSVPPPTEKPYDYREYPTPTEKNSSCILDKEIWALFEEINGFGNIPNKTDWYFRPISVELNDHFNSTHIVSLKFFTAPHYNSQEIASEIELVWITYKKVDEKNGEIINKTVDIVSLGRGSFAGPIYSLTAYIDRNNSLHVFWRHAENFLMDAPQEYYLFYEKIDSSGEVIESGKIFYFEKRGGYLPIYIPPEEEKTFIPSATFVLTIVAIAMISAVLYKRYKPKKGIRK